MAVIKEERKEQDGVIVEALYHDSNNVLKTSYNYTTNQLIVTFIKGGVYNYNAVSVRLYEDFKKAEKGGTFLNANIKKSHTAVKKGVISEQQLTTLKEKINSYKSTD